jgi:hypothetical protein
MDSVFSNRVAMRESKTSPRRAAILAIVLGLVTLLMGCDRESTSTTEIQTNPGAVVRIEITSNPTGQPFVGNVGDETSTVTISGTTPFIQDAPAPG